jgi:hypothetical protein
MPQLSLFSSQLGAVDRPMTVFYVTSLFCLDALRLSGHVCLFVLSPERQRQHVQCAQCAHGLTALMHHPYMSYWMCLQGPPVEPAGQAKGWVFAVFLSHPSGRQYVCNHARHGCGNRSCTPEAVHLQWSMLPPGETVLKVCATSCCSCAFVANKLRHCGLRRLRQGLDHPSNGCH